MATWEIYENSTTVVDGLELGSLPVEAYRYVTPIHISIRGHEMLQLQAGSFVGALPLVNGDTLLILPRIGRDSFSRMLFLTEGLDDAISEEFQNLVQIDIANNEASHSLLRLFARPYVGQLHMIERQSLSFARTVQESAGTYARGSIHALRTARNISLRSEQPICSRIRVRDYSIAEHRFLATALLQLHRHSLLRDSDLSLCKRWFRWIEIQHLSQMEFELVSRKLQRKAYAGPRAYYATALLTARLILSQAGLDLNSRGDVRSEALVTNMASLFERYVREVLARAFIPRGYIVEAANSRMPTLFNDGTCQLRPDIVISDGSGPLLIADAKYKPGRSWDASDLYQLNTYVTNFQTGKGILIFPDRIGDVRTLQPRRTMTGDLILEIRIGINDWQTAEEYLVRSVEEIIRM